MSKKLIRVLIIAFILVIFWLIFQYMQEKQFEEEQLDFKPAGAPVVVTVFYEVLCPDSKNFVVKQLSTAYKKLPHLVDIAYVPYGKAITRVTKDGSLEFDCQHGPIECEGNIVHACTVDVIADPTMRINLVACMIADNMLPKDSFHRCAKEFGVHETESTKIIACSESPHGKELLKVYGEQTAALRPKISFIPTVLLDGSQRSQAAILKNLKQEICEVLTNRGTPPEVCT
ncbi:GILT-like protein 1 [Culicoides brevitarsis]|uniref:GILT-like protein 1 n=1 Tax=Culicoides brevitarsis TaxID=469753 RepID=UPI00307B9B7F